MDILSLLQCLQPSLTRTTVSQLSHIVLALLTMSGRVTMLGIARWTEVGGSYPVKLDERPQRAALVLYRDSLGAGALVVLSTASVPCG